MPEILTLSERRISGTGLILPDSADLIHRRYTLFADIIRKPLTPYLNRESEPPETYYGVISLMKNDYVLQTLPIKYDAQIWYFDADISGQTLIAVKCEYLGVLESFANLGTALGLTVTLVENTIGDYRNLPLQWDSINIKCFADCAIQFVLKALTYDFCETDYKDPAIPAQPPAKPEIVSPGVGTDVSDPYPGDGVTDPVQIDKDFVPPPLGNVCQAYTLRFTVQFQVGENPPDEAEYSTNTFGPVSQDFRVKDGQPNVLETQHRGNPLIGGCGAYEYRDIRSFGSGTEILSWSNIRIE